MRYYGFAEIEQAYKIKHDKLKDMVKAGKLKGKKLKYSRYNWERYKWIIPESELVKLGMPRIGELKYYAENQPEYYAQLWEYEDRQERDYKTGRNYYEYMNSEEWRKVRTRRLALDGFKCQRCGSIRNLNVHHINYEHLGEPEEIDDIVTLCKNCHEELHREEQEDYMYEQASICILLDKDEETARNNYFYSAYKKAPLVPPDKLWEIWLNVYEIESLG